MAEHITKQMNETLTPPSLHWPYFRKMAAAQAYQMTKVSKIGPKPCKKGVIGTGLLSCRLTSGLPRSGRRPVCKIKCDEMEASTHL
eukprot:14271599-Ditylum_brightwellii.AAC.1